jgi:hypothetical protein
MTFNPPVVKLEVGELDILLSAYPLPLPKIQQRSNRPLDNLKLFWPNPEH